MQTVLPDLPFSHVGFRIRSKKSAVKSSLRKYPRTDLRVLDSWDTFQQDIHEIILDAMTRANIPTGSQLTVGDNVSQAAQVIMVANEEDIREYANTKLHRAAQGVLAYLGCHGAVMRSAGEIIGDPDFAWVRDGTEHPKVVVCLYVYRFI